MYRNLVIFFTLILLVISQSCNFCTEGDGRVISKEIEIGNVTGIKLACSADVEIVTDTSFMEKMVEITAESNLLDLITIEQIGSDLKIDTKSCIFNHQPIIIKLKIKKLKQISINGSGTVKCTDTIKCDELELTVSGSGSVDLNIDALTTDSRIDGSGDVKLKGISHKHKVTINGSGEVGAFDLLTDKTFVNISGSGDCSCNAKTELGIHIKGSGDVYYKGEAKVISELQGSGEVIKK